MLKASTRLGFLFIFQKIRQTQYWLTLRDILFFYKIATVIKSVWKFMCWEESKAFFSIILFMHSFHTDFCSPTFLPFQIHGNVKNMLSC